MALDSTHPEYNARKSEWTMMRDFYEGETKVKAKGEVYLPATASMRLDGMAHNQLGRQVYNAYLERAVFPEYVKDAVEAYIGLLHQKPATIELPTALEPLREKATTHGESLDLLLRRINEEQLVSGRGGLLLDLPVVPDPANPLPYLALYNAESIRNWDDGDIEEGEARLNLVVLDESGYKRGADLEWKPVTKFRVLVLGEAEENEPEGTAHYRVGVFQEEGLNAVPSFVDSDMTEPMIRGVGLEKIPFTFFNSKDITAHPDVPPLLALGRACLSIYRGEADYRQNLFMQGQDTFVIIGDRKRMENSAADADDEPLRTGAGSRIELETGGDAKYVGVSSNGLTEQREALKNDRTRAENRAGQLVDSRGGDKESGEALKTRVAAQAATLNQIAMTGAAALQKALRDAAEWLGADPEQVKVQPNLEFTDYEMTGENLVKLMTAKSMGAPISLRSIHNLMTDQGLTRLDYETEQEEIETEAPLVDPTTGVGTEGDPADENA
jgi:hypothetical protein